MYVFPKVYMSDFETTVTGEVSQADTEVWAAALVQVKTPKDDDLDPEVYIDNSLDRFMARLFSKRGHSVVYFHNLKFDGSFIIDWLLKHEYVLAINDWDGKWREPKYMSKKSFRCTISNMGVWYTIEIKTATGDKITIKDSLKLLPFSVDQIGKGFNTRHKKLSMEYVGDMHAGGTITEEQKKYITNDVLVVKEALEIFFDDGLNKLTIGSCCKDQYKKTIMQNDAEVWFPSMHQFKIDANTYGSETAEAYIRLSYKGGWCYLKKGMENQVFKNGCTADVNSLYPSMMLDKDYPTGKPIFWSGNEIPAEATKPNHTFIVRVKTRFYLKKGMLPTIQIKRNPYYKGTEWLDSSDLFYKGKRYRKLRKVDGEVVDARPTLTLTEPDYKLLLSHYDLEDFEILDGCYFWTAPGELLFGSYIHHWADVKMNSKGAKRQEAKLFLNNLYGKFAAHIENCTKAPYLENDRVKFYMIEDVDPRKEWYIPIGTFITAYAREFTITAAQTNYDRFIYADTDSIHCTGRGETLEGIKVHNTEFSHWCLEAHWDEAIFVRQKTYIEHVVEDEDGPLENPYYNIKCAGMDKRPRQLLNASLSGMPVEPETEDEKRFLSVKRSLEDFRVGLTVPSKLITKRIRGGIVLVRTDFCLS